MMEGTREEFVSLRESGVVYLNGASRSPMPECVHSAGVEALSRKKLPWTQESGSDAMVRERFQQVAGICGKVAITPSTSFAMSAVADALDPRRVVVLENQMSSNVLPWRCRSRCELEIVPIPGDGDWTRGLLDRIERESVVAIPHCHWADGSMLDLHQVSKACRDSNSSLVVDATQSMGVVPLDVDGPLARLDFVCASTHKWLLGPYGCSPLLVGPDRAGQAFPSSFVKDEHNLVGADDDDVLPFHQTPVYERHFDGGGRPNPVLLPMVAEGLRFILEDLGGPRNVSRHTEGLVAKALDLVGLTPQVKKKRAPHFFGIPSDNPRDCAAFLERERGVHVTGRLGFLRVAFHAYNTPRDVDALASALTDYHNAVS